MYIDTSYQKSLSRRLPAEAAVRAVSGQGEWPGTYFTWYVVGDGSEIPEVVMCVRFPWGSTDDCH